MNGMNQKKKKENNNYYHETMHIEATRTTHCQSVTVYSKYRVDPMTKYAIRFSTFFFILFCSLYFLPIRVRYLWAQFLTLSIFFFTQRSTKKKRKHNLIPEKKKKIHIFYLFLAPYLSSTIAVDCVPKEHIHRAIHKWNRGNEI